MDAFIPREEETPEVLNVESLINVLISRLEVHPFFSFTYKAAVTTALIFGEANLIGQYIEVNYTLKLNLSEGTAVLFHEEEEMETYQLDKDDFEAYLDLIRQEAAAPSSKIYTPETLAPAVMESLWPEDHAIFTTLGEESLAQPYAACILVAAIHGDCRVAAPDNACVELVIHPTKPVATLFSNEEVIDAFKLDADSFAALRAKYSGIAEEDAE